ncbi:hypothetical protein, partial [Rhizobium leguminosarum]|uniref:hypothetical protein n=1 Tax=Rhizobium leguminosarum TaxID=384 RepID=UPI001981A4EE
LSNAMSITPEPPLKACEGRLKHGSILNGNIWLRRVSSQWKSTTARSDLSGEPHAFASVGGVSFFKKNDTAFFIYALNGVYCNGLRPAWAGIILFDAAHCVRCHLCHFGNFPNAKLQHRAGGSSLRWIHEYLVLISIQGIDVSIVLL